MNPITLSEMSDEDEEVKIISSYFTYLMLIT